MKTITRTLIAVALLAALVACGNKGALIKPSQVPPPTPAAESMPVPPDTNPVDTAPETPAADDGNG